MLFDNTLMFAKHKRPSTGRRIKNGMYIHYSKSMRVKERI